MEMFLKMLGCALVLAFNNISYSSDINNYNNSTKSESNFLSPLQLEYNQIVSNFSTLYDKCDTILNTNVLIRDIVRLLNFSSPFEEGTSTKLKNWCDEYIEWCNLYPKYHKMKENKKNLLKEIVDSCNKLKKFLKEFGNMNANQKQYSNILREKIFQHYVGKLLEMDKKILEFFKEDSDEQIALHGVILNALKMNTVFRGDDPEYSFEYEIEEVLNNILKLNNEEHFLNEKQLDVVNELVILCEHLATDVTNFEKNA